MSERSETQADASQRAARSETRVQIQITNPLPAGLFAIALGAVLLAVLKLGWVPSREQKTVGLLLLAFAFPLQSAMGLLSFFTGRAVSATVFAVIAAAWLSLGLALRTSPPGARSDTVGALLLWLGFVFLALALISLLRMLLMSALLSLGAPMAVLAGVSELGNYRGVARADGVVALALAVVATYGGLAFVLEEVAGREILPLFRPSWRR